MAGMPRKSAAERHAATEPSPSGTPLVARVIAFHHPVRRRLFDVLAGFGPAPVGVLARRCHIAVGSASYHLGVLHRSGWVEPAPDLVGDTRESWWRPCHGELARTTPDQTMSPADRNLLGAAEHQDLTHEFQAVLAWLAARERLPQKWRHSMSSGALIRATDTQLLDLKDRMEALVADWSASCTRDQTESPHEDRWPVRVIARVFPAALERP